MAKSDWSARGPVALGMLAVTLLVGGVGWWSATQEIAGAVVAPGQIEVQQNRQVVQHLDGGVVAEIDVHEGDTVKAGDLLIRLDGTLAASDLAVTQGQLYEVMARSGRLEAERDGAEAITFDPELVKAAATNSDYAKLAEGQERLFQARKNSLDRQTEQLSKQSEQIASQIEGIDAQIEAIDTQTQLIAQELGDPAEAAGSRPGAVAPGPGTAPSSGRPGRPPRRTGRRQGRRRTRRSPRSSSRRSSFIPSAPRTRSSPCATWATTRSSCPRSGGS